MFASSNGRSAISAQPSYSKKLGELEDSKDAIERHERPKEGTGSWREEKPK